MDRHANFTAFVSQKKKKKKNKIFGRLLNKLSGWQLGRHSFAHHETRMFRVDISLKQNLKNGFSIIYN